MDLRYLTWLIHGAHMSAVKTHHTKLTDERGKPKEVFGIAITDGLASIKGWPHDEGLGLPRGIH